ncbi:MAG TPA: T9SS type A sorting domain-containing protein, partial [Crocinitomicaceae bacterium]|nr:T9SS type A sorting domain-containing protein [Crocinitomicaceae bacterium]
TTTNARVLNLGSSEIILTAGGASLRGWFFTGANKTLNAGTSHIRFINPNNNNATHGFRVDGNDVYNNVSVEHPNHQYPFSMNGTAKIKRLIINGNANFQQNIEADTLILGAAKTYIFTAGVTATINEHLEAVSPPCNRNMNIRGNGTFAMSATATTNLDAISFSDITFTGANAPYASPNSLDLGGNTGIDFPILTPQTLYWVGGTGNWNDPNHWSTINNGVYPSVGGCIPTPMDTVVFNTNSGVVNITLDNDYNFCRYMLWDNAPNGSSITGTTDVRLYVYGSMQLQANMTYAVQRTIFISSQAETLRTNGTAMRSIQLVGSPSSSFSLMDNLSATGSSILGNSAGITFTSGTFITNGHNINTYNFVSNNPSTRSLFLGNSTITINARGDSNHDGWIYIGNNDFLDAGTSTIVITSEVTSASMGGFQSNNNRVYHNVKFTHPNSTLPYIRGNITANKVEFMGGGRFYATALTFDTLLLTGGKKYLFWANGNMTINKLFKVQAVPCSGLAEFDWFSSSTPTIASRLNFVAGATVMLDQTLVNNINVVSGMITATNSIEGENVTNISFPLASGTTYYWVGGTGNWNDVTHWSTVNDGVYPSVTGCIPKPTDNVVFNANSDLDGAGKTVTLDGAQHYCFDLIWENISGTPKFVSAAPTSVLNVSGSATLQREMSYEIENTRFNSSGIDTLRTNGAIIYGNISKLGINTLVLADSLIVNEVIAFSKGTLNTNNQYISIYRFSSTGTNTRTLLLGSSTIVIKGAATNSWEYIGTNKTLNAGTSHIMFTVSSNFSGTEVQVNFSGSNNDVYYNVTQTSEGSTNFKVSGPVVFNKLHLNGSAIIQTNNTLDTLILTAGRNYLFFGNTTQTINEAFYPNGNPCRITTLNRTQAGNRPKIVMLNGNTNFDYINIANIDATGSHQQWQIGSHSEQAVPGSNVFMNFAPYDPGVIDGLGGDIFITDCDPNFKTVLNVSAFNPVPGVTTHVWSNGSTADTLLIDMTMLGTQSISVNYGEGCIVNNSITVACPLPIELISFNAVSNDCSVSLTWTTGTETNNERFEVYRSTDGKKWTLAGVTSGAGNSSTATSYRLIDTDVASNGIYYYRLKQIDFDGRSETFNPKSVQVKSCEANFMSIYPNPATDKVTIAVTAENMNNGVLEFMSVSGELIYRTELNELQEQTDLEVSTAQFPNGVYLVRLTTNTTNFPVEKLMIAK